MWGFIKRHWLLWVWLVVSIATFASNNATLIRVNHFCAWEIACIVAYAVGE